MDIVEVWAGVGLGVVAVALAVLFHLRSNRDPKPGYWVRAEQLVGEGAGVGVDEIVITFAGERVPNVWRTKVGLSNAGNGELDSDAIAATDPLRLVLGPRTKVLGDPVVRSTQHVDFDWEPLDDDGIGLVFDFMNPGAAALVEVVHTGRPQPRILGEIKGVPRGFRYKGALSRGRTGEGIRFRGVGSEVRLWAVVALATVVAGLTIMLVALESSSSNSELAWRLAVAVGGGLAILGSPIVRWLAWDLSTIPPPALFDLDAEGTI